MKTFLLLLCSNIFMTIAWYGHLKYKNAALWMVIVASWLIALPEYCLAIPANRIGHLSQGGPFSGYQLKIMQEGISVLIFLGFAFVVMKETPRWQDLVAFTLIVAGLAVALSGRQ